jgi:hypothetical protein
MITLDEVEDAMTSGNLRDYDLRMPNVDRVSSDLVNFFIANELRLSYMCKLSAMAMVRRNLQPAARNHLSHSLTASTASLRKLSPTFLVRIGKVLSDCKVARNFNDFSPEVLIEQHFHVQ